MAAVRGMLVVPIAQVYFDVAAAMVDRRLTSDHALGKLAFFLWMEAGVEGLTAQEAAGALGNSENWNRYFYYLPRRRPDGSDRPKAVMDILRHRAKKNPQGHLTLEVAIAEHEAYLASMCSPVHAFDLVTAVAARDEETGEKRSPLHYIRLHTHFVTSSRKFSVVEMAEKVVKLNNSCRAFRGTDLRCDCHLRMPEV